MEQMFDPWYCPPHDSSASRDTFTVSFVCDRNAHNGTLRLLHEELSSTQADPGSTQADPGSTHPLVRHDVFFEFSTSLVCVPAPVNCHVIGKAGGGARGGPVTFIYNKLQKRFFINVCLWFRFPR